MRSNSWKDTASDIASGIGMLILLGIAILTVAALR